MSIRNTDKLLGESDADGKAVTREKTGRNETQVCDTTQAR